MRKRPLNLVLLVVGCVVVLLVVTVRYRTSLMDSQTDSDRGAYLSFSEQIMATTITVQIPVNGKRIDESAAQAQIVFDMFHDVDEQMSEWRSTSSLTWVNQSAGYGRPVPVSNSLLDLVIGSMKIGDLTDGAFDITWAALWGLWDFKAETPQLPDPDEITRRLQYVNYRRIEVGYWPNTIRLPVEGMMIGLGGIAKGYALDQSMLALQEEMGLTDFLLSAGGQVMVCGLRSGRPWRVGIRDPRGASADDYFGYVELDPFDETIFRPNEFKPDNASPILSVSTSGDYERYFILDGVRYHHILDPQTGWPADGRGQPLRSATVVCRSAKFGDALSTALMILGTDRSLELIESLEAVEALLVDDSAHVHMTSGMAEIFTQQREPNP